MRIATELRVKALLRRCSAGGASAFVMRRGDGERGALFVKVATLDGRARLFGPRPASFDVVTEDEALSPHLDPEGVSDAEADAYLMRQVEYDPDLWVIEIEDREGRSFLDD
jgi:hypothetical protein